MRLEVDKGFWHNETNQRIPDSAIKVVADTGWYDRNNQDAIPGPEGTRRMFVGYVPGDPDPKVFQEFFSKAIPAGYLSLSGGGMTFYKKGDPRGAEYLHHSKRTLTRWDFSYYLKEGKNEYLHPRFTPIKAAMRAILKTEEQRRRAWSKSGPHKPMKGRYPATLKATYPVKLK